MLTFNLDTHFENKESFYKTLSLYLINLGARQCKLVQTEHSQTPRASSSVTVLAETYPAYQFKLGNDLNYSYSLYTQFDMATNFSDEKLEYLAMLMQTHFTRLHLNEVETTLTELSHRDEITNLFNQRKLYKDIDQAIETYQEEGIPFSFLFIDIDHFKSVNDGHGHLIGSNLLIQVGNLIKSQVREIDLVYRYGGDEFVVLLPKSTGPHACQVGERILEAIKGNKFKVGDSIEKRLSVSIGVSDYPTTTSSREGVIKIADEMMYSAKKNGRGMVFYNT